jgi:hypothetical protein
MPPTRSYMVDLTKCNELILPFTNLPLIEDKIGYAYEIVGYAAFRTTVLSELIKIDSMLINNDKDSLETREDLITPFKSLTKTDECVYFSKSHATHIWKAGKADFLLITHRYNVVRATISRS